MPNWCNNSGSIVLPENASPAAKAAFELLANHGAESDWMGLVLPCPPEMNLGINSTEANQAYLSLEWLKANSKFTGDFGTIVEDHRKTFTPSNEYLEYLQTTFKATNWYDWRRVTCGTKWDVCPDVLDVSDNRIDFACESAWTPIDEFMRYLGSLGLKVKLIYFEDGNCFSGELTNETSDGSWYEDYREGEEHQTWQVLENGQDLEWVFSNLEEYATFEEYSADNELPDSKELVDMMEAYYKERSAD
jgi:hypothetical protein